MLVSLSIRHIVLIESLYLDFRAGFCVFTGETGAGKSILLDALGLALGRRADAHLLRTGAERGEVSAEFALKTDHPVCQLLSEQELVLEGGQVLLRRVLSKDGRSKCFINDRPVSLQFLKDVGEGVLEVHGQFDHLLDPKSHRQALDAYGAIDVLSLKSAYSGWRDAERALKEAKVSLEKVQAREAFVRFTVEELRKLNPKPHETESLEEARQQVAHHAKVAEALKDAHGFLDQGSITALSQALKNIQRVAGFRPKDLAPVVAGLDQAILEIEEAQSTVQNILQESGADVHALDKVESRLYELRAMARKHHVDPDHLYDFMADQERELKSLDQGEEHLEELTDALHKARSQYEAQAQVIRQQRIQVAKTLSQSLKNELAPLKLQDADLSIQITPLEEKQWSAHGMDHVEFYVRTNPGSPFGPLTKIASGGERSRLMLALKVILAENSRVPVLIFDEIDAGTSGAVASSIGERLKMLSSSMQVMSITHSPQVAAFGDQHLFVHKKSTKDQTTSHVRELSAPERHEELARLLSGENITDEARAAAKVLLGAA